MAHLRAFDRDLSARGRREGEEAAGFDMVADDAVTAAVQAFDALDFDGVAAGAADPGSHRVQQLGQVADMGLAGRIVKRRRSARGGRGDQNLFRRGDACLVQEKFAAGEPGRGVEAVGLLAGHDRAELAESVEVAVETAAADHIAARRVELRLSAAGQQRRREEDAGPVPRTEFARNRSGPDVPAAEGQRMVFKAEIRAEFAGDVEHGPHVEDVGDVVENDLLVGQQQRRDHRQRRVLVSADPDPPRDAGGPLHFQTLHRCSVPLGFAVKYSPENRNFKPQPVFFARET